VPVRCITGTAHGCIFQDDGGAVSETRTHEAVVGGQFGSRAAAYLASAVHAQGRDLEALAALGRNHPGARVLDLGCGGGHVTFNVAPHVGEVIAYDLSPQMLNVVERAARERGLSNVTTREGVAESLPFADGTFDLVLSRFSAHHWREWEAGLREARRVLKPGGTAAFVDTVSPGTPLLDTFFQAIELLRDCSHVRNYSRSEWEAAIVRAGMIPAATTPYRLGLEFTSWVERMNTPQLQVDAIRALQAAMSASVMRHFEIAADGSFTIDVAMFEANRPPA
jgi:SAM-dependent methyltransferase